MFIIRLLLFLFMLLVFGLVFSLVRMIIGIGKTMDQQEKEEKKQSQGHIRRDRRNDKGEIIELDEDQYKVE